MIYKPHTLLIYKESVQEFDEDKNPIIITEKDEWVALCGCRCDDNNTIKQIGINGVLFDFSFHVVYQGDKIAPDTKVKCLEKNGNIRGEGKVIKSNKTNRLNYAEIWIQ